MNKFHQLNAPRVEKILKMLDTIETSARSNKASNELAELLAPVRDKLDPPAARMEAMMAEPDHEIMSRERLDFSIACSKANRAVKACELVASELQALKKAIPEGGDT